MNFLHFRSPCVSFALLGLVSSLSGETIIDDHFDDGVVTGWASLGNSLAATHTITEEETALTSVVLGTEANLNTNRGIVSAASFNPLDDPTGFTMTFEVTSQGDLAPGANGMFLGLTSSDETFFRLDGVFSFGLVFYGHPARSQSQGGVSLVTNDVSTGGPAVNGLILDQNPDAIELTSFQDGFTATITADATGWSFSVEEVKDIGGVDFSITNSGTWEDAGTDFNSVFGDSADWYVLATNQGAPSNNLHTVVYDRIALITGQQAGDEVVISSISPMLEGENPGVTLEWNSISGAEYAVEFSYDLTEGSWIEVTDSEVADGSQMTYVHDFLPGFPSLVDTSKLFYRIRKLP